MSEKYIDLARKISLDWGYMSSEAWRALKWLDSHPDQVPGRTITESELESQLSIGLQGEEFLVKLTLKRLGITVVPDPEPTIPLPTEPGVQFIAHSSKLSDDPEDQREFVIAGQYIVALDSAAVYSRELFEDAGWTVTALVTAPGGDDD